MFELATELLIVNARVFVQHWVGYKVICREGAEMTHLMSVPLIRERYLYVDGNRFREFICEDLGVVWDCYIFRICFEKKAEMLKKPTKQLVLDDEILSKRN